uniref:Thioredoxin domain-containing protein 16 n=1 Tax=Caenorhabditis tropicalis TaxID=1561998 RepID=A0A1I7TRU6_9PELO
MNKEDGKTRGSRKLDTELKEQEEDGAKETAGDTQPGNSETPKTSDLEEESTVESDQELLSRILSELEGENQEKDQEEDQEEVEEEAEEEEVHVDEQAVGVKQHFGKDIGVLATVTIGLAVMIYLLLMLSGLTVPARPLVVSRGAAKPFFHGIHRRLIEDSYDGKIRLSANQTLSVVLLYSPYSFKSKQFRDEYFKTARTMKKLHGNLAPYFGATNCFDRSSSCRRKYNLKKYPVLMAQNAAAIGSIYNGPLSFSYLTRWLNRLQNPVFRLHSADDVTNLIKNHDLLVILYYQVRVPPNAFRSATNFTKVAFGYLDGDPNSERVVFCVVNDPNFAAQLQLHNEHDVVIVSSELKLLKTQYKGWTIDALFNDVTRFSNEVKAKNVEFLNLGKRFHSTQLAEKFEQGSVLLFFTRNLSYGNGNHEILRRISKEYRTCPEQDMISIETPEIPSFVENCSISLEASFCKANNTLTFMMIDSEIENALATKYGAEVHDMVIAVSSKQEITRYIRKNITRENINCLIRQHHNSAENEFVTESTEIITTSSETPAHIHSDAVGDPSYVKFVKNVTDLLKSRKINVIMFSGGIWHSASSSAIAPFHLVANHFLDSRNLINFSMVDVSETYLPYNLNFDQLPKILITSADSIGLSWTYPEEFMINHTNIIRFVLTRPGKIFGRLRWLDSCQGACRKRAQWEMQTERLQLKRQLSRNVANSRRQRESLGYYDRMIRMIS